MNASTSAHLDCALRPTTRAALTSSRREARRRLNAPNHRVGTAACAIPIAIAMLVCSSIMAAPPRYRAIPIAGGIGPAAINEAGSMVGTNSSPMRAWVSHAGGAAEILPLPPGAASSWASDISDAGVVVGATSPTISPEFGGRATAWTPVADGGYEVHVLGALPGHVLSNATALNNVGDIVGFSSDGTYRTAVRFSLDSPPQSLASTGIFDPRDVNDQRVVADGSFTVKLLDLDTMAVLDLGHPGTGYLATSAAAINESGQVAGAAIRTSSTCDRVVARFTDRVGWEVLSSCRSYNGAQDINDHGDLVMTIVIWPYLRIDGEGTHLLDELIEAEAGTWTTFTLAPLAINNARQIATNANNAEIGFSGAVLLTPILEGDLDGDGNVTATDLSILLSAWGSCTRCGADLDRDGQVGASDLAMLLAAWSAD